MLVERSLASDSMTVCAYIRLAIGLSAVGTAYRYYGVRVCFFVWLCLFALGVQAVDGVAPQGYSISKN